jgi:replicative DNA helicase
MSQFKNLNTEQISDLLKGVSKKEVESEKSVKDFIAELEKEIKSIDSQIEKEESYAHLVDMLKDYAGEDKIISSLDIAERIKNRPQEKMIMSGYKGLDDILKGFRPKQLVIISAPTKSGKTSFCIELTSRMKDENPMWLPFEEGAEELIQKFLDRNEQPPLFFTPSTMLGNTLLWVEKKIIEAKAKYNSNIIFIDHLHFIVPFTGDRQDLAIGQAMRELKRMAKTWDVTIFLIAHLKKTRMDTQPDLEDLRDSSFIAQEADTVIMLWRKMERNAGEVEITNNVNVSVQANRRTGKTGNVKFKFEDGKFTEDNWENDLSAKSEEILKGW